ncbi:MAG: hypothetical protein JNM09_28525 [Blastocatellia bacterium]|nr:hypothetical protein [Blastocatellia bacterium]
MQTVGLLAGAIERENITTTSVSLLREVTSIIHPPRALFVPYPMGFPLGAPNNPALQHQVIAAGLALLERTDVPVLEVFK